MKSTGRFLLATALACSAACVSGNINPGTALTTASLNVTASGSLPAGMPARLMVGLFEGAGGTLPLHQLGVEFAVSGAWSGNVYVDAVSW